MTTLVLNRAPLTAVPYHAWLGPGADIVLLTDAATGQPPELLSRYREIIQVDDYVGNPIVEHHAERLHHRYAFDTVVALAERDVLRAARLRERWGLPGQHLESALAFRDKLRMKDLLSAAGIPLARYLPVRCAADLFDAPGRLGYPLVVKPRRAAGAEGVAVLTGEDDLVEHLAADPGLRGDDALNLLVEEFVEHELYLVDGLVVDGRLAWSWCSWMSSNLGHRSGEPLRCTVLEPTDPMRVELQKLAEEALCALPVPDHTIVHIEIFDSPGRGLVFNEVASRVGGARIDRMLAASFGTGPTEAYLRGVGSGAALPDAAPRQIASFAMFRPRPGVLTALPQTCPLPGVVRYEPLAAVGARLSDPVNVVSAIASVLTAGASRTEAEAHLAEATHWFEKHTVIAL